MISSLKLVRNVGSFDSYQANAQTEFRPLTLIFAENGRGKTTLGAILRSLATGESHLLEGRCRLGAQQRPHVVIEDENSSQPFVYQNGQWTSTNSSVVVFDDQFVDDNVYSGLSVGAGHRQNLHEVILGKQGVTLARRVDELANEITELNTSLRQKASAIPKKELHNQDIDVFCALPQQDEIDKEIGQQTKQVDALKKADAVKTTRFFSRIDFPLLDIESIDVLLGKTLEDLDNKAIELVQEQFSILGPEGESWVSDGTTYLASSTESDECPYCGQEVKGIQLVEAYRAYFGESYRTHLEEIELMESEISKSFGGDALALLTQSLSQLDKRYTFWKSLLDLPAFEVDNAEVSKAWINARDVVVCALQRKQAAPLEKISLDDESKTKIHDYNRIRMQTESSSEQLVKHNDSVTSLKEATASGSIQVATEELDRLKAIKSRHSEPNDNRCEAYLEVRASKADAEQMKQEAREALDTYRQQVFPKYRSAINSYLSRFGAAFTIEGVKPQDKAGKPSTAYHLSILNQKVPLQTKAEDSPGFHNTLSAGDRNTLALAFFFASLQTDENLSDAVIVIDDPISSFDSGRSMTTMQEVRKFCGMSKQVIVMSHVKAFLCRLYKHAKPESVSALHLRRMGECESTLEPWEPTEDEFTEYDHNHRALREFHAGTATDIRRVAKSLRPVMEGYLRVAYPEHCPPGTLLGKFRQKVQTLIEAGNSIMSTEKIHELDEIREYANRFHHDTNPAWESEVPSDSELLGFVNRVFSFISD